jgi:predicted ATP-dependent endonuclease of OLD family
MDKVSRRDTTNNIVFALNYIDSSPEEKEKINYLIYKIIGYELDWSIENDDDNRNYMSLKFGKNIHNSDGLGDGIISLIVLLCLLNIKDNGIVLVDEPELYLHPAAQKKLFDLLIEESKSRQIIISTHSPYFVDFSLIKQGAKIIRVFKDINHNIEIGEILSKTAESLGNLDDSSQNPHTFRGDMKEILFLRDNVIVVEGQEDVVCFNNGLKQLKLSINGEFFGWGAGGAENIYKGAGVD